MDCVRICSTGCHNIRRFILKNVLRNKKSVLLIYRKYSTQQSPAPQKTGKREAIEDRCIRMIMWV
jgi:hypothetical protein